MMSDSYASEERNNPGTFKEAVCIDAMRVYDSCSDKEYASYILAFSSRTATKRRKYDVFKFFKSGSVTRSCGTLALITKIKRYYK